MMSVQLWFSWSSVVGIPQHDGGVIQKRGQQQTQTHTQTHTHSTVVRQFGKMRRVRERGKGKEKSTELRAVVYSCEDDGRLARTTDRTAVLLPGTTILSPQNRKRRIWQNGGEPAAAAVPAPTTSWWSSAVLLLLSRHSTVHCTTAAAAVQFGEDRHLHWWRR